MIFREANRSKLKHYYELELRFDVSSFSSKAKELMDSLNSTMHSFGFNEDISLMSGPLTIEITANRELQTEEKDKIRQVYSSHFKEAGHKVQVSQLKYKGVNT